MWCALVFWIGYVARQVMRVVAEFFIKFVFNDFEVLPEMSFLI